MNMKPFLRRILLSTIIFILPIYFNSLPLWGEPAAASDSPVPEVKTYDQLLQALRKIRESHLARGKMTNREENLREVWEIGRLIQEHVRDNKGDIQYRRQVFERLSQALGIRIDELYYRAAFARAYPAGWPENLSWAHYTSLLSISDPEERVK